MKKQILTITSVLMIALSSAFGGTYGPISAKCPVGEIDCCADECNLGFNASIGYETDYIFRGFRLAQDSVWADLNYTVGNLTVGVWGIYETDTPGVYGSETDFYASYALPSILGFDTEIGYTYYDLPGGRASHEPYAAISRDIGGFATFDLLSAYELNLDWYHEASLSKSFTITDNIGLDLSGGIGYYDSSAQTAIGRGVSHWFINAGFPITLNCRTTITPYVAYTDSDSGGPIGRSADALTDFTTGVDTFHGGVSLSVDF